MNDRQNSSIEPQLLTWKQRQFLAKRLLCGSDSEAAAACGTSPAVISRWKHEPEFLQAYEELPHDGLEFAKASHRQMLAKATMVHAELLDSLEDKVRLGAVKLLYEAQGLMVQKTELTGAGGGPVQVADLANLARLNEEELALYERLCERAAGPAAPKP